MGLPSLTNRFRRGQPEPDEEADDPTEPGDDTLIFSNGNRPDNSDYTAIPRQRGKDEATASERKAKMIVWGMLSALPVATLAVIVAVASLALGGGGGSTKPDPTATTQSRFGGYAHIVAVDYLAGRNTIVPNDNSTRTALGNTRRNPDSDEPAAPIDYDALIPLAYDTLTVGPNLQLIEIHHFAVHTGTTALQLTIPIADNNGPTLAAFPSLTPLTTGTPANTDTLAWDTIYQRADLTPGTLTQITRWAAAFAANDQPALFSLTGDPTPGTYTGLGGFTLTGNASVTHAALVNDGERDLILATIQATFTATNDTRLVIRTNYDLLITNPDEAEPKIAAWGPVGTANILVPYQNRTTTPEG